MIKLEIGKTYRTRNGEIVKIERRSSNDNLPFVDTDGCSYTPDGYFSFYRRESEYDLIEEIPTVNLKVGGVYKNRKGETVRITLENSSDTYPFEDSEGESYTPEGFVYEGETNEGDLIEEVTESEPEGLTLKVGHKYLTRGGKVVEIVKNENYNSYPFLGVVGGCFYYYTPEGCYNERVPSEYDLISEYNPETTINLEDEYVTRDGNPVKIFMVDGGGEYPVIGAMYYSDDKLWRPESWTSKGVFLKGEGGGYPNLDLKLKAPESTYVYINVYRNTDGTLWSGVSDDTLELSLTRCGNRAVGRVKVELKEGVFDE